MPGLTIASFNTHYGLRRWPNPPRTPFDLEAALRDLEADVLVIQEYWRPDGKRGAHDDAAAALGLDVHYELTGIATGKSHWPGIRGNGEATIGIAVLTRLPTRRIGSIQLGPTRGDPAPARTALHVEIDVDGSPLQLVGVHLSSRLPHAPVIQLRRLARHVPSTGPAVIAGDCNFWGPGVRTFVRGGWRRAVRGRTWPAAHPHSQIDHILVRDVRASGGRVMPDVGSDHRPIRAHLSW